MIIFLRKYFKDNERLLQVAKKDKKREKKESKHRRDKKHDSANVQRSSASVRGLNCNHTGSHIGQQIEKKLDRGMLANTNKFFDATRSLQNFNQTFKDSGFYYQGVMLEPVNENAEHSPSRLQP